jgi:hypothetical protein
MSEVLPIVADRDRYALLSGVLGYQALTSWHDWHKEHGRQYREFGIQWTLIDDPTVPRRLYLARATESQTPAPHVTKIQSAELQPLDKKGTAVSRVTVRGALVEMTGSELSEEPAFTDLDGLSGNDPLGWKRHGFRGLDLVADLPLDDELFGFRIASVLFRQGGWPRPDALVQLAEQALFEAEGFIAATTPFGPETDQA